MLISSWYYQQTLLFYPLHSMVFKRKRCSLCLLVEVGSIIISSTLQSQRVSMTFLSSTEKSHLYKFHMMAQTRSDQLQSHAVFKCTVSFGAYSLPVVNKTAPSFHAPCSSLYSIHIRAPPTHSLNSPVRRCKSLCLPDLGFLTGFCLSCCPWSLTSFNSLPWQPGSERGQEKCLSRCLFRQRNESWTVILRF